MRIEVLVTNVEDDQFRMTLVLKCFANFKQKKATGNRLL